MYMYMCNYMNCIIHSNSCLLFYIFAFFFKSGSLNSPCVGLTMMSDSIIRVSLRYVESESCFLFVCHVTLSFVFCTGTVPVSCSVLAVLSESQCESVDRKVIF